MVEAGVCTRTGAAAVYDGVVLDGNRSVAPACHYTPVGVSADAVGDPCVVAAHRRSSGRHMKLSDVPDMHSPVPDMYFAVPDMYSLVPVLVAVLQLTVAVLSVVVAVVVNLLDQTRIVKARDGLCLGRWSQLFASSTMKTSRISTIKPSQGRLSDDL